MKPTYDKFIKQLEGLFGQRLNSAAVIASQDFWGHWDEFKHQILNGQIKINIDIIMLGVKMPIAEFKRHHPIKGFAKILFAIGLISLFFNWKIGIVIFIAGTIINMYGNIVKRQIGENFIKEITSNIHNNNHKDGMAKLCSHYLAGTVQFVSAIGKCNMPSFPSNCITGKTEFIQ